jgi:RNA polymerase sigma-70 factor (ECF subfamily)
MTDEEIAAALSPGGSGGSNSAILARAALNELLTKNYSWIVRMCVYELNNQADAYDCAQEVMVEIIKSIRSFNRRSNIRTWMYTITRRSIYRYRNRRRSLLQRFVPFKSPGDSNESMSQAVKANQDSVIEISEQKQMLLNCLKKLPEKQRQAVVLHYFEDLPVAEAAAYLDCSVGTVKTHLHRARKKLAEMLKDIPELLGDPQLQTQGEK